MTAGEILAQVDDMKSELTGLIDVQAGAVTALVEGGGAQGQMSLSLELPVMIDATTRAKFVQAASEGEVSAVYATLAGTSGENVKYAIKGNASNAAVKALWDKAVAAALIASQIDLTATQINIAAEHVVIAGSTNHGQTIIEGGKIRAALIEVEDLLAKNVELKNGGSLRSNNFDGTINNNGQITADGTNGWAVDNAGKVIFNDAKIRGEINATTGTLDNVTVNGFYTSNNTPFQPMAMINIGYNNGTLQLTNNKNIKSVTRNETGVFSLSLKKGVWLKTHSYKGYDYIDVFAIGNAADKFDAGFKNMLLMTPNWLRNYVNGRLTQNNGYAYVDYVILYFTDNNTDQLIDPKIAQCFIFGTESD